MEMGGSITLRVVPMLLSLILSTLSFGRVVLSSLVYPAAILFCDHTDEPSLSVA